MNHRVWFIHGFNVFDGGKGSIGKLRPYFENEGFETVGFDYGWRGLIGVRLLNDDTAEDLFQQLEPGDILVGHSNGCDLIRRVSLISEDVIGAVLINPALDRDAEFGPWLKWIDVLYNTHDWATWFAEWLLFHPWGSMGRYGYTGDDPRVRQHDTTRWAKGHSGVFKQHKLYGRPLAVAQRYRLRQITPAG